MTISPQARRWLLGQWSVRRLLRSIIEIYLMLLAVVLLFANRLMFHPPPPSYVASEQVHRLTTRTGDHVAAIYESVPGARYTLLVSHGNAEDMGQLRGALRELRRMGFSTLAYDYPGFGLSDGTPSEDGAYAAVDAAYEYLTTVVGIPNSRIILYGRSIGSGPSVDIAVRRKIGALVLDSPFVSAFRVATHVPLFPFDRFQNLAKIRQVSCPTLIVHGTADTIVPQWHGERLFQGLRAPKLSLWAKGTGHIDALWDANADYLHAMRALTDLAERSVP